MAALRQDSQQSHQSNYFVQPAPTAVDVIHVGCHTVIARDWASNQDPKRCRLCPLGSCSARGRDHCTVVINRYVAAEDAALFTAEVCRRWPELRVVVSAPALAE